MQLECVNDWNPEEFSDVLVVAIPNQWQSLPHLEQLNQKTQAGWLPS